MNWFKVEPLIFLSMFLLIASHLILDVPLPYVFIGEILMFILVAFVQLMQGKQIRESINRDMKILEQHHKKQIKKKPAAKVNEDLYSLLKRTL